MTQITKDWLKALAATVIHGAVSSALTIGGLAGASTLNIGVPSVNLRSFVVALCTGGAYAGFLLLKKSPLPGISITDDGDITKGIGGGAQPETKP